MAEFTAPIFVYSALNDLARCRWNADTERLEYSSDGLTFVTRLGPVKHVLGSSAIVNPAHSVYVSRYVEVSAGVTLEIGADADLEIG